MQRRNALVTAALAALVTAGAATAVAANGDILSSHASPNGPGRLSPVAARGAAPKVIVQTVPGPRVHATAVTARTAPTTPPTAPVPVSAPPVSAPTPTTMRTIYVVDPPPATTATTVAPTTAAAVATPSEEHGTDHGDAQGGHEDD